MRRTLYSIAALAFISLTACNKNDDGIETLPDVGTLVYKNTSADQYDFYLDNTKLGNLYGGQSASFPGTSAVGHQVKVVQIANIVGSPIIKQQTLYVPKDAVIIYSFP